MKKIIIWFTWEMWCGKDSATNYIFKNYWWKLFKFSSSLRDILSRIYLDSTRENLSIISRILREWFWQDVFAKIMKNDIELSDCKYILIDWVRRKEDIIILKEISEFILIYIETNIENRYSRISSRSENPDDKIKTFEQFKKDQFLETEIQIKWLKEISDYVIDNNWNLDNLYFQIDKIISSMY